MKSILIILGLVGLLVPVCERSDATSDDRQSLKSQASQTITAESQGSPPLSAQEVMNNVAKRYSSLTSYSCRGTNVHKSTFDGKVESPEQTDFTMEYNRGKGGSIQWSDRGVRKELVFDQKISKLSENGRVTHSFSTPRDGLMTVELSSGGWTLFEINLFVFRDELKLGDKGFFLAIKDPVVSDECEIDGRPCYLLSGKFKKFDGTFSYWIDKTDYVVRKIESVLNVKKQTPEKTWVRTTTTTEEYRDIQIK